MDSDDPVQGSNEEEELASSDDDSMDDDAEDAERMQEVEKLNKVIEESPFNYQAHVDRITLLRKCGEFEQLNAARKSMANMFPLTQKIWLEWLEDEQKFAESEDEHKELENLFELAVKDYMCPEIWLEYAQYAIRFISQEGGFEKIRGILERGLSAVGLHVSKGASVWEAYREIENAILVTLQPSPGSICTEEQNEMISRQVSRIDSLFCRQLAVPLLDMEQTMQEYFEWIKAEKDSEEVPQHTKDAYEKALRLLEELTELEKNLEDDSTSSLESYEKYIAFEKRSNDPARVQMIYERAVAENCLNAALWDQYLKYLNRTLKGSLVVVSVFERAVRNCPWTSGLWQDYLVALEKNQSSFEKLQQVLNEALSAGFSSSGDYAYLWQAWCDISRRRYCEGVEKDKDELARQLRSAFESSTTHLLTTILPGFGGTGDPDYTLWCYWARCEAKNLKNITKARMIMDNLMEDDADARRNWKIWKEYYEMERLHGDIEHARGVLRHAVQSSAADDGSAEAACSYYIIFERENGSLEDLEEAKKKVEGRLAKVQKRKEKVASQMQDRKKRWEQNGEVRRRWKNEDNRKKQGNKRPISKSPEKLFPDKRTKFDSTEKDDFKAPSSLPIRFNKSTPKQTTPAKEDVKPRAKIAPPPGYKPKDTSSTQRMLPQSKSATSQEKHDIGERTPENEEKTVFISNVGFEVENVEEKLKEIFSPCGKVSSIRLVRSNKGNFRGYAYVEFDDKSSVEKALKLDRKILEGRPMFVSPNVDKHKHPEFKVFKYSTGMEKHKLFISGMCYDTTEDTLRRIFSVHGSLRSVRIVTNRSGKPKGLAYVEYDNEADATQAVMKTDQTVVDGFTIKVAISNPPVRSRPTDDKEKVLGRGRPTIVGGRGRGRTQVALLPRSLLKTSAKESPTKKDSNDNNVTAVNKPMSNSDFAKLLTKR